MFGEASIPSTMEIRNPYKQIPILFVTIFMKLLRLVIVLVVLLSFFGCRRTIPRPEGLPPLVPCTVSVTFGGEKIANVGVLLRSKTPDNRWGAGGRTNSDGKVVLKTAGAFEGVVPGEYVISFSRRVTHSDGPMGGEYSLIPEKYAPGRSEETITVTKDQAVYVFELDGLPDTEKLKK